MPIHAKTVAVVDDDPSALRGLARLLSANGFEPATYSSADAFLEGYVSGTAICLVLDVDMPGTSGIELRRRLTENGSTLPVTLHNGAG